MLYECELTLETGRPYSVFVFVRMKIIKVHDRVRLNLAENQLFMKIVKKLYRILHLNLDVGPRPAPGGHGHPLNPILSLQDL